VSRAGLAAITLDRKGGGVAAVSRLLWRIIEDHWGSDGRLFTLVDDARPVRSLDSSTGARLRFGARLARAQALRECDWLFFTHLSVAKVQSFVPARICRPYAVFLHGIEAWRPLGQELESVLKGAALRVANSAFTARRIQRMHPTIGEVLPCPLALSADKLILEQAAVELRWQLGQHAVVLVARMSASERYKGHEELIAAWPGVLARVPDARLVFVGEGDDVTRLTRQARALGIEPTVVFTDFVSESELTALYRQAAVFAMPSRGEGFGLVYLEAMAERLPCIGATDDAAGEIIVDGETGFLVRQADREALTDRLVRLLRDESLRRQMGEAGHRRLHERFTYAAFSQRVLSLIESSLETADSVWGRDVAV
jgi:phosphatidyl-myo-inositol dimannoside synthase